LKGYPGRHVYHQSDHRTIPADDTWAQKMTRAAIQTEQFPEGTADPV